MNNFSVACHCGISLQYNQIAHSQLYVMPSGNVLKSHLIKDSERQKKKPTKKKQFKLQIKGINQWEMLHHGIIMMTRNTDFYPLLDLKYTPLQTCAWQLQKPWTSSCSYYFTFSSAWRKNAQFVQ